MELHRELNELKQTEIPWMYEVSKTAPQEALRDLDRAYRHFFRRVRLKQEGKWQGKVGFPKYKTKRKGLASFRLTGAIHVYEQAIELPRLGRLRLKECGYLPTEGVHILSVTVSEEAGHWFVSAQVEEEVPDPPAAIGSPIGVDSGIKTLAQCSDGRSVADTRLRPSIVILEDLNVDGMRRNRHLALAISDVGLAEFKRQIRYKTAWQGEVFLLADRWFPLTKMCSGCGQVKAEMDLSERVYECDNPRCNLVIDRDHNAALNLAALGNEVLKLARQNPDRSLEEVFHEVIAKTMRAHKPGPYREILGKGETPVEREALADPSPDGSVKLPSMKQEPDIKDGRAIFG